MRKAGSSRGAISAYPRQLEALIRLSEAHARMRFSNAVEMVDVEEAKRYVLFALIDIFYEMDIKILFMFLSLKILVMKFQN